MHVPASAPVAVNQEKEEGRKKSNGGYRDTEVTCLTCALHDPGRTTNRPASMCLQLLRNNSRHQ